MKIDSLCCYHYSEGNSEEVGFPATTVKEAFQAFVREVACEESGAIWGKQAGGREENEVLWDTD